jgi:hypothetical protein
LLPLAMWRTESVTVDPALTSLPEGAPPARSLVNAQTIGPRMINPITATHSHSTLHL